MFELFQYYLIQNMEDARIHMMKVKRSSILQTIRQIMMMLNIVHGQLQLLMEQIYKSTNSTSPQKVILALPTMVPIETNVGIE